MRLDRRSFIQTTILGALSPHLDKLAKLLPAPEPKVVEWVLTNEMFEAGIQRLEDNQKAGPFSRYGVVKIYVIGRDGSRKLLGTGEVAEIKLDFGQEYLAEFGVAATFVAPEQEHE